MTAEKQIHEHMKNTLKEHNLYSPEYRNSVYSQARFSLENIHKENNEIDRLLEEEIFEICSL